MCNAFPGTTIEKLKAVIFDGPQMRQLMNDRDFIKSMNGVEKNAWEAFAFCCKNFLETENQATTKSYLKN